MSQCEWCQKDFEQPKYRTVKFCGRECQKTAYSASKSVTLTCQCCSQEFTVRKSESDRKYCSQECYVKDMPNNPDSIVLPKNNKTKICEHCSKEFSPGANFARTRFCSRDCGNASRRTLVEKSCATCGQSFVSKKKDARFCSRACYMIEGPQGRPPGEMLTFTCVGCGNEHTVPKNYPSKKMYCSNKCAKKEQKKGWSKRGAELDDGSLLIFRSDYETRFYALCLRFDVPCRNYDGPDIETSVGVYRPDFIIVLDGEEHIVEVKGYVTPESAIKTQEASEQIENFMLVLRERLLRLEQSGF